MLSASTCEIKSTYVRYVGAVSSTKVCKCCVLLKPPSCLAFEKRGVPFVLQSMRFCFLGCVVEAIMLVIWQGVVRETSTKATSDQPLLWRCEESDRQIRDWG